MENLKQFICLVAFLTLSLNASAQYEWMYGELVLKSGDSLYGQIEIPKAARDIPRFGRQKVKFRTGPDSKTRKYGDKDISEIIFVPSQYEILYFYFIPVGKKRSLIMRELILGDMDLYTRTVSLGNPAERIMTGNPDFPVQYIAQDYDGRYSDYQEYYVKRIDEPYVTKILGIYDR